MYRLLIFFLFPLFLSASYTVKEGKFVNTEHVATLSVQEYYAAVLEAYEQKQWEEVIHYCIILQDNFAATPFAEETTFYLGMAYFHTAELDRANHYLTRYLKKQTAPKFFEEAIQYKFHIAELYHQGAKKHLFGWSRLPKWMPAREDALAIYEEVIAALPHHDLAAQALFSKARLKLKEEDYTESIETFQTLVRRFPKHPLAIESFIGIAQVYLTQSTDRYPDQDYLDLAEINIKKFKAGFPGEERITEAEKMLIDMKEVYASSLYEIGRFYERTKKPHAAAIYYNRILTKYPETATAQKASQRLAKNA